MAMMQNESMVGGRISYLDQLNNFMNTPTGSQGSGSRFDMGAILLILGGVLLVVGLFGGGRK